MNKVRSMRENRGLTQQQLAVSAGIDRSGLSQIETGAVKPNLKTLEKIAIALRCNVSDLI